MLPVDQQVIHTWGTYCAGLKRQNMSPSAFDSLIAPTALHHHLTLVTRNVEDFPEIPVLNPWEE